MSETCYLVDPEASSAAPAAGPGALSGPEAKASNLADEDTALCLQEPS